MNASYESKRIFVNNFKKMCAKKCVRCADVARELNIAPSSVWSWVHYKSYPTIESIESLSKYFNCNKIDLIEEENVKIRVVNNFDNELAKHELIEEIKNKVIKLKKNNKCTSRYEDGIACGYDKVLAILETIE